MDGQGSAASDPTDRRRGQGRVGGNPPGCFSESLGSSTGSEGPPLAWDPVSGWPPWRLHSRSLIAWVKPPEA